MLHHCTLEVTLLVVISTNGRCLHSATLLPMKGYSFPFPHLLSLTHAGLHMTLSDLSAALYHSRWLKTQRFYEYCQVVSSARGPPGEIPAGLASYCIVIWVSSSYFFLIRVTLLWVVIAGNSLVPRHPFYDAAHTSFTMELLMLSLPGWSLVQCVHCFPTSYYHQIKTHNPI